ncbi:CDP-diacylglycerol-inositol 3-phosphatidyltransferase [Smittium culicis]|uniref:CDP-diacylglycerol--inositol 3-phosphatidyltransferase n=1 Tax=Smittium culicis TaxID=133412 RepID=A0A1R1YFP7_9FUNG|nr:CDP-diacylglycerol-inositol 3-phosphatidyltransferase [Smittium culicis]
MVFSYALSEILDAADGYFARKLNQCSKFGEVLDMVTDRCTTTCLLTYLAQLYPKFAMIFCFLISLDISSHYMQMYASLSSGNSNHKIMDKNAHPILKAYYTNRSVLFWFCFGNEAFFIVSYYIYYISGPGYYFLLALLIASFPIFAIKNTINVVQLYESSKQLAIADAANLNKANSKK